MLYVTTYRGPFGFIKPWTAVRDEETFSQQFLTPATLRGIEQRLFPELLEKYERQRRDGRRDDQLLFPELLEKYEPKIRRYRLRYKTINTQTERTQPKAFSTETVDKIKYAIRKRSILKRGVLIEPELLLAFETLDDARRATQNHVCLCRNEDVLFPETEIRTVDEAEFIASEPGFELVETDEKEGFLVGYNRFENSRPMFGKLLVVGNPLEIDAIF